MAVKRWLGVALVPALGLLYDRAMKQELKWVALSFAVAIGLLALFYITDFGVTL